MESAVSFVPHLCSMGSNIKLNGVGKRSKHTNTRAHFHIKSTNRNPLKQKKAPCVCVSVKSTKTFPDFTQAQW